MGHSYLLFSCDVHCHDGNYNYLTEDFKSNFTWRPINSPSKCCKSFKKSNNEWLRYFKIGSKILSMLNFLLQTITCNFKGFAAPVECTIASSGRQPIKTRSHAVMKCFYHLLRWSFRPSHRQWCCTPVMGCSKAPAMQENCMQWSAMQIPTRSIFYSQF